MEIEPVWNSKVGSRPGVRGGRSVEKLRSTRGRKQCIYGGTAKLFLLLFLSILWGPAPKPPVLTSFEGNVILTVYFER